MNVIENQQLWFDTALSYRARVEKDSFGDMISHIYDNISVLGLEITDSIVVTVCEEVREPKRTILGVEFIVPVNKQFESNCHYVFKPHFKLENAVLLKYCGKASELPETRKKLREYALEKHYSPLTNVYFSIKQISGDDVVANAYLGVDGNTL
ncbi:MAG: hypothetical protein K2J77_07465 [Oscillospiraceae bacterium]|nr:hypothetical protein [Oscillospiraceae bacterium]